MEWTHQPAGDGESGFGEQPPADPAAGSTETSDLLLKLNALAGRVRELHEQLAQYRGPEPPTAEQPTAEPEVPEPAQHAPQGAVGSGEDEAAPAAARARDVGRYVEGIISAAQTSALEIRRQAELEAERIRLEAQARQQRTLEALERLRPATVELQRALQAVSEALDFVLARLDRV